MTDWNEDKFQEKVAALRKREQQELEAARRRQLEWDAMLQRYLDAAKTPQGLNTIEVMLRAQDRDSVELCKYIRGLIDEIRRLRGD